MRNSLAVRNVGVARSKRNFSFGGRRDRGGMTML